VESWRFFQCERSWNLPLRSRSRCEQAALLGRLHPKSQRAPEPRRRSASFFAFLGDHGEFSLALLDIKHGIRCILLRKDNLFLADLQKRFPVADLCEKGLRIEGRGSFVCHKHDLPLMLSLSIRDTSFKKCCNPLSRHFCGSTQPPSNDQITEIVHNTSWSNRKGGPSR